MSYPDITRHARRLIEQKGWAQGGDGLRRKGDDVTGLCLVAAVGWACASAGRKDANKPILDAVRDEIGDPAIIPWNDDRRRTKKDVTSVLDRVARRLERPRPQTTGPRR